MAELGRDGIIYYGHSYRCSSNALIFQIGNTGSLPVANDDWYIPGGDISYKVVDWISADRLEKYGYRIYTSIYGRRDEDNVLFVPTNQHDDA